MISIFLVFLLNIPVQGPNAAKARGEKLVELERFQEASESFGIAAVGFDKIGDTNAAQILREMSSRYGSVLELYTQEPIKQSSRAKFEPESGMYLGANIERETAARTPAAFNKAIGKDHAMYFMYRKYGVAFPRAFAADLKRAGASLQLAWEPDSLSVVQDDQYLATFSDDIRKSGIPVFVRFASEMNGSWTPYSGNPLLYKEKFRLVANRVREIAPNAAMVWSPNAIPEKPIPDYYPGADYVDWVGVNFYSVMYNDGDRYRAADWRFPTDSIDYVYNRYSAAHPIMVAEWAASHRAAIDSSDRPEFAQQKIREFFLTVPVKYPRLKAASWLSFNAMIFAKGDRQLNNYSLFDNPPVAEVYREQIKDPYFLSQIGSSCNFSWKKVTSETMQRPTSEVRFFARSYDPQFRIKVIDSLGGTNTFSKGQTQFSLPTAAKWIESSLIDSKNRTVLKRRFLLSK